MDRAEKTLIALTLSVLVIGITSGTTLIYWDDGKYYLIGAGVLICVSMFIAMLALVYVFVGCFG